MIIKSYLTKGFSGGKGSSVVTQKRLFSGSRRLSLRDDCRDLRSFYTRNIGIRKPRVDVHATGIINLINYTGHPHMMR